jgi:hypothetical protein
MAFVVVFACVLVCGLELFAVMRIRRLQEDNAALRQRLSAHAERIESGVLKIDERFGKERDETQEQYGHLDGRFNELHTDTQASPAAADDRIDRLRIDIAARLAQVEKGIPNLANSEEVIGLLSRGFVGRRFITFGCLRSVRGEGRLFTGRRRVRGNEAAGCCWRRGRGPVRGAK